MTLTVNKYINYLHEIMQDHYENNKSIYNDETPEWKKVDRINHKIMWIVRDYFEKGNFNKWLEQSPIEYDEIHETSDKDILTINFHGKDIYWHTIGKDNKQTNERKV